MATNFLPISSYVSNSNDFLTSVFEHRQSNGRLKLTGGVQLIEKQEIPQRCDISTRTDQRSLELSKAAKESIRIACQ